MAAETVPRRRRAPEAKKPGWRRTLVYILIGVVLFFPLFGLGAAYGVVPLPVVNAVSRVFLKRQPDAVPWTSDQPVNVLVMGLQVGGASVNPLTDSMMVVSYDPRSNSLGVVSIPRDLWVTLPGHGEGRINEAFEDGGAAEAMLTVQQNLGIPVNYYALVSYGAFEKLIDDVGGVTVDVPKTLDDPTFPAPDEIHFEPLHVTQGVHHFNGHDALRYARTRHADTDFGRASRQQQILLALKSEVLRPANILKAGLIFHDVRSMIRTNFPMDEAPALGLRILRAAETKHAVLSSENNAVEGWVTGGGAQVLAPNHAVIRELVNANMTAVTYLTAGATVRVDNGNGYTGAATGFSKVLESMGVKVLDPGDADSKDYQATRVQIYTKDSAKIREGKLIAGMLGVEAEAGRGHETADVVVTLGRNYAPYVKFTSADWKAATDPQ